MRKTKIVCTLGPATDKGDILEQLVKNGLDVSRSNFSHGDHDEHLGRMNKIKEFRKKYNRPVAILLDTKGPEIRIKDFKDHQKINLEKGQEFVLRNDAAEGDQNSVAISFPKLYKDVKAGSTILIDDGLVELTVLRVEGTNIVCKVINTGTISDKKGVNVPNIKLSMPFLSDKDREDLAFGCKQDVDFVAASFTRRKEDIEEMRTFLAANGGEAIQIIAKIENQEGVNNIDAIIEAADGIMVARGDMGVEIPCEEVPSIQKSIIKKTVAAGKMVITATQMLDSMMKNPRPTRAEVTDVANAIYDGTSATMLSGETANGSYSLEAFLTMKKIAERTEEDINYQGRFFEKTKLSQPNVTDAISHATCTTAHDLNAKYIITVTKSGATAKRISRFRPDCDIIAGTTSEKVARQLNLTWGVTPIIIGEQEDVFELFDAVIESCKEEKLLEKGDITVMASGLPVGMSGTTNMIKVHVTE